MYPMSSSDTGVRGYGSLAVVCAACQHNMVIAVIQTLVVGWAMRAVVSGDQMAPRNVKQLCV